MSYVGGEDERMEGSRAGSLPVSKDGRKGRKGRMEGWKDENHVLRITHDVSRFTFHVSRFTFYA
jgi:hypothetical protein